MAKKPNLKGSTPASDHFTKLIRATMETPAWRALSTSAQALYPWLKLEWRGPQNNNNGRISLAVGAAAQRIGVKPDTAARAFHDLQAKGFIVVTDPARLGVGGAAAAPKLEITEIALPHGDKPDGRKLYRQWREGEDFPVVKAQAHNPRGINRKTEPYPENRDGVIPKTGMAKAEVIPKNGMVHPQNRDGNGPFEPASHPQNRDILTYQTEGRGSEASQPCPRRPGGGS
jgi:hypothetical protein